MAQYTLQASNFQPGMVGDVYHVGISDGMVSYGYMLQNRGGSDERSAFNESSNVTDKEKLTQYSSTNLIDRDLVYYPRESQGDFSGGSLQVVGIDLTKYFDSDLEIRTPGYLMLRPAWQRNQLAASVGAATAQCVAWNNNVYSVFGGSNYYNAAATSFNPSMTCKFIDTDGNALIIGDGLDTIKFTIDNVTFNSVATTTALHTFSGLWLVNQGTNGRFLYYAANTTNDINSGSDSIYRIDMTSIPTAGVLLATNLTRFSVVDIQEYQNGIAILTNDPGGTGLDVWYHDGVNMTRIVRVNQYAGQGMCPCLGDLYVTAISTAQWEAPVVLRISTGSFEVVVRTGSPLATQTTASIGAPESSGQYVYFALTSPQIAGVTATSYIGVYDVVTNSYSHLGGLDGLDAPQVTLPRQIACSGRAVTFPMVSSSNGFLQYQTNSSRLPQLASPQPIYAASGWMVGSKLDFGTPGIGKRFRRVELHHSPLASGEAVQAEAFIDQDPLSFTTASTPVPSTATVTNSTVGSNVTTLVIGSDQSVGRSMFPVVKLTAGTNQLTTPKIIYTAVEVGGTWVWDFDLDCTNVRRTLAGQEDPQGVGGKDLYFLLRNAYENGKSLTLYLASGQSFKVNVEALKAQAWGYFNRIGGNPTRADQDWLVHVTLRQEL